MALTGILLKKKGMPRYSTATIVVRTLYRRPMSHMIPSRINIKVEYCPFFEEHTKITSKWKPVLNYVCTFYYILCWKLSFNTCVHNFLLCNI